MLLLIPTSFAQRINKAGGIVQQIVYQLGGSGVSLGKTHGPQQQADLVLTSRPHKGRSLGIWQPDPLLRLGDQPIEVWLMQNQQALVRQLAPTAD